MVFRKLPPVIYCSAGHLIFLPLHTLDNGLSRYRDRMNDEYDLPIYRYAQTYHRALWNYLNFLHELVSCFLQNRN